MNLASIIDAHDASRVALIDGDVKITYGELRDRVAATRQTLADHNIGRDDQVAIMAGNETTFVVACFAIMGVGGVAVPIRPGSPFPELQRKLATFDPKIIIAGESGLWTLDRQQELGFVVVDGTAIGTDGAAQAPPIADRADDDLAFLLLTSGVTSDSKVAMLSHHNLQWVQEGITANPETGLVADDLTLGVLPFSHIFGLNVVLLASLRVGAAVVLQRRFDPEITLDLIHRHQITRVAGAPPMWQRWAAVKSAPGDAMASVKHAGSGAAALPIEVFDAIKDRFGVEIAEGYGLTETSPIVTWSSGIPVRAGSVGVCLEGVHVVIVEDDGTPVDPGDSGEIVVRSPGVFKGYLNAPETTASVLTDDGWFWTGDIGAFDDDGYLYLVDRVKDLIIVSGFNVYPAEVEAILAEHPAVQGAVVVAGPHAETGETVVAHVVGDVGPDELDAFARERLSRYKCPTEYKFVTELPVAATGKVIRRELR